MGSCAPGHHSFILKSFGPPLFPDGRWLSKCLQELWELLACTGTGAACTDQTLQAGQPFLLQLISGGAVKQSGVGWEQPPHRGARYCKSARSFCLSWRPGGLYFATTRDGALAAFEIVSSSKIHISAEYRVSGNIFMHDRLS